MIVVVLASLSALDPSARYEVECEVSGGAVERVIRAVEIRGKRGREVVTGEVLDGAAVELRASPGEWGQLLEDAEIIAAESGDGSRWPLWSGRSAA